MINCAVYGRDGKRRDISLDAISDVLAVDDGSFVWVGLYEPDEGSSTSCRKNSACTTSPSRTRSNAHQRPKIEAYGNSLFIAVHTAQSVDEHIRFGETHAFLGPRYLVTVRHGASLSLRAGARARWSASRSCWRSARRTALYVVLDFDRRQLRCRSSRSSATTSTRSSRTSSPRNFRRDTIVKLYDLKRELTQLRLAVAPLQDILGAADAHAQQR